MTADKFWKIFWLGTGGILIVGLAFSLSLFFIYIAKADLPALVGVTYDPSQDPFEGILHTPGEAGSTKFSGFLYEDSIPLRFSGWVWHADADWRSSEEVADGPRSIKATFQEKDGGTIGINGPAISMKGYSSITLSVFPGPGVGDMYLELFDAHGNSIGVQSLGWYTKNGVLATSSWQKVTVPLKNLLDPSGNVVTGWSISSKHPGVAYIDSVSFSKDSADHAPWVMPVDVPLPPYDPFATSTPASLPYMMGAIPDTLLQWHTYFGSMSLGPDIIKVGPLPASTSTQGSISAFRGGKLWTNYKVNVVLDWGETSVFSLLTRFADDGNFASCAFSRYGETVQIYQVTKGDSVFLSQSPGLPTKDLEPWKDVHVGAQIEGNKISCLIDGEKVLSATLSSDLPKTGTVGIETWDQNSYAAPNQIKSFSVSALDGS
jgi:hypothetical protein